MSAAATITLKLGGALVKYAPSGRSGSTHSINLPEAKSVSSILDQLQVPTTQPLMIIHNDSMVARTDYETTLLADGDKLSLMQPIQAG